MRWADAALSLIGESDWADWQGEGFVDLAEIRRLSGRTADAVQARARAADCFAAEGNLVSARRAGTLVQELRAGPLHSTDLLATRAGLLSPAPGS